jgi:hypothetical protein
MSARAHTFPVALVAVLLAAAAQPARTAQSGAPPAGAARTAPPGSLSEKLAPPEPLPPQPPVDAAPGDEEELPPLATGEVLSERQIRWCLAEKLRIDAVRPVLDRYNRDEIRQFNERVANLNARCSSYRYFGSARQDAAEWVEAERPRIEREAREAHLHAAAQAKAAASQGKRGRPGQPAAAGPQTGASHASPAGAALASPSAAASPSPPNETHRPRPEPARPRDPLASEREVPQAPDTVTTSSAAPVEAPELAQGASTRVPQSGHTPPAPTAPANAAGGSTRAPAPPASPGGAASAATAHAPSGTDTATAAGLPTTPRAPSAAAAPSPSPSPEPAPPSPAAPQASPGAGPSPSATPDPPAPPQREGQQPERLAQAAPSAPLERAAEGQSASRGDAAQVAAATPAPVPVAPDAGDRIRAETPSPLGSSAAAQPQARAGGAATTAPPGAQTAAGEPVSTLTATAEARAAPAPTDDREAALARLTREVLEAASLVLPRPDDGSPGDVTAQLEVRYAAAGFINSIGVAESSGSPFLDEEALTRARALSLPGAPEALRGREFAVRFPVVFRARR